MKRITILALLASMVAICGAQSIFPASTPKDARDMALGGAYLSLSTGYDAFYGNPAAFALGKGELTVADLSAWFYVKPTTENIAAVQKLMAGGSDSDSNSETLDLLTRLITENGFGGGASVGLGYAGRGLGIGAYVVEDVVISGQSLLGAKIVDTATVNAVIGLGVPIKLGGLTLAVGGDVRPYFRVDTPYGGLKFGPIVSAILDGKNTGAVMLSQETWSHFGLAMDFGARISFGALTCGLSIRDVEPSYLFARETVSELLRYLSSGNLPRASNQADSIQILPSINAGLSWSPRFLPRIIDPSLFVEVQDPVGVIKDKESIWNLLHAGAELKFLSFISARAGINKGWLSVGAGIDLAIVEIDAAVFTEELGRSPGDFSRSGITVQAALRF